MSKHELRKESLAKRKELSSVQVKLDSLRITDIFTQNFDFKEKTVHCFIPIAKNNEVDTWLLIDRIMEAGKLVISKSNFEDNSLEHFYFEKNTELVPNKYEILEPINATPCEINNLNIVLIPLLVFDKKGNRVGYGGGFYDRFIAQLPKNTQLIGLSLFEPVEEIKDLNTFDKRMQICITPNEIFYFDK